MIGLRSPSAAPVAVCACVFALSACKRVSTRNDASDANPPTSAAFPAAARPAASGAIGPAIFEFSASDDSTIKLVATDGAGKHEGQVRTFSGRVLVPNGSIREARLTVDIDLASLGSGDEVLRALLEIGGAPNTATARHARFVSSSVESGGEQGATNTVKGELVSLGVTQAVEIPSTIHLRGNGVDLDGEFTLSRKALGLILPGKASASVKDEIVVSLLIAATRVADNASPE